MFSGIPVPLPMGPSGYAFLIQQCPYLLYDQAVTQVMGKWVSIFHSIIYDIIETVGAFNDNKRLFRKQNLIYPVISSLISENRAAGNYDVLYAAAAGGYRVRTAWVSGFSSQLC